MSLQDDIADLLPGAPLSKAAQIARRMTYLYLGFAVFIAGLLTVPLWPARLGLANIRNLAHETIIGGQGVTSLAAILLSLVALVASVMMLATSCTRWRWMGRLGCAVGAPVGDDVGPEPAAVVPSAMVPPAS